MKKTSWLVFSLLLLGTFLSVSAQTGTQGSILGTVKDSSGAVVPGAQVVVTNIDTGIQWDTSTSQEGFFQVLGMLRGNYSVAVSKAGFSTWKDDRIELQVGQAQRISPVLNVGQVHQEVTVSGTAGLVQTEEASVESAIDQKTIQDLPVNGRDPIQLVQLVPGMTSTTASALGDGNSLDHSVEGFGIHEDATQFSVDGVSANDPSAETGFAIPNLESIGQFRVETFDFSAENGRQPLQVIMATRSGTNEFHGSVWNYLRNDAFDANEFFSGTKAALKRNQFGFTLGGPIFRQKTFFFTSFQETIQHSSGLATQTTIDPAFLNGDFSSVSKTLINPSTNAPFSPRNQIPTSMFSTSSTYFFKYIQLPNKPNNLWQYLFPTPVSDGNYVLHLDHNLTQSQRLSLRWIRIGDTQTNYGYDPAVYSNQNAVQHNLGGHYDWTINPNTLFTAVAGFVYTDTDINSPVVGKENLTADAGIQGFSSDLIAGAIGLPTVTFTGYQGFSYPQQVPASFKREVLDFTSALKMLRNRHTITVGSEYLDNRTLAHHASAAPRGAFNFNGQYTGNGFADYLLGMVQSVKANVPLADFGMAHSPYSGFYAEDDWRILPNLTLNLGFRADVWWQKALVRGCGATFDAGIGKAVAGEVSSGKMDLNCQPVAPFLAQATSDLWVPASQVGFSPGLSTRHFVPSPRVGLAWRPTGSNGFAVRAGYGLFTSNYNGNVTGSAIIGPPYWLSESITYAKASQQNWQTAFPATPGDFVSPSVAAPIYDIRPMKTREWNLSVEKALPFHSALTVSYVGNRGWDLPVREFTNSVAPGKYTNLQASLPYPKFGTVNIYKNLGTSWYNAMIVEFKRRFVSGLSFDLNYALGKSDGEYATSTAGAIADGSVAFPWMPPGYNEGPTAWDHRHIVHFNAIYDIPFGRGRRFGNGIHGVEEAALGGWQPSAIFLYSSGDPLTLACPGATLGNGQNARPDLTGDPHISNPSAAQWFDTNAFTCPAPYTLGNSGIGPVYGPGQQVWDTALMKNFYFTADNQKYMQFRWQMYNALNHRNLADPGVTVDTPTFGEILGAGSPRLMEFALKIVF